MLLNLPKIYRTIICVIYLVATLIINPVTPLVVNKFIHNGAAVRKTIQPSQSVTSNWYNYNSQNHKEQSVVNVPVASIFDAKGSFAGTILNRLAAANPTVNQALGLFRNASNIDEQNATLTLPTKIYGEGTESKFPPLLEGFLQRVQTYFSVYRYPDLSRPGNLLVIGTPPDVQVQKKPKPNKHENEIEDYNEILSPEPSMNSTKSQEDEFIKIGEDDNEPGLELRFNSKLKKTVSTKQ